MTHVVVAADKFKGSATAAEVGAAVAAGIHQVRAETSVRVVPVADGGDGTLAAAEAAGYRLVPVTATGPTGEAVRTAYARKDHVAVVEMADVSGLARLPAGLEPMTATSRGTGEVVAAAVDAGCTEVVLGIGGSASTDGGAGLVAALGADLATADGGAPADGGAGLHGIADVDLTRLRQRIAGVRFTVACDVDNPLTGPRGAASVYGPQKGADPDQVTDLDDGLAHWADVLHRVTGADRREEAGAGAAGGVGFAALAVLGATLRPGIDLVLDLVDFHPALAGADLVVTGEGALDEQTLHGKAPAGVAAAARSAGIPVVAVCGVNRLSHHQLQDAGIAAAYALLDLEPSLQKCLAEPLPLLTRTGVQIARDRLA